MHVPYHGESHTKDLIAAQLQAELDASRRSDERTGKTNRLAVETAPTFLQDRSTENETILTGPLADYSFYSRGRTGENPKS